MNASASPPSGISRAWVGVVLGGLVAGCFDILYAIIANGIRGGLTPLWVLQSVASGLLGKAAFDGGVPTGLLGLFCHFVIAMGASTLYFLASRKLAMLRERPLLSGALFGILVYLFMNFVVIPLSAFPFPLHYPAKRLAEGFFSHAVLIGIPIAWLQKRFSGAR
ncbi:MAG: DUF1440 domain-containing protein [Acidobacteriota bacterium]